MTGKRMCAKSALVYAMEKKGTGGAEKEGEERHGETCL